jgi:hypothetical protein
MPTARVTVTRNSPDDAQERQVVVAIDGRKVATLMYGDAITAEVEPGPHKLRVHNTLVWKTRSFSLDAGADARFTVVNRPGGSTNGLLTILGARPLYLTLIEEPRTSGEDA